MTQPYPTPGADHDPGDDLWRQPAGAVPSCPICGTSEYVARDTMGGLGFKGDVNAARQVWLCVGQCWTAFDGSTGEWERCRKTREMRAKHRAERGRGPQRGPAA